ncbi:1-(5-phosphoribosyl)-5-[(5-phosphoribosylamino)methylideneamino]imidazole-4-carboxamide isomerase [bacterium]|nr:1-(5-phosphoribosyl)-5-[(5-phosphoribosylamino)methylideneamino]imidazole-4-carboxamide isomerase [bacterium]
MLVIPAIDLLNGKCVRLYRGEYDKAIFSLDDPISIAISFEREGASWLHIVDLEGAKLGKPCNLSVVKAICENTNLSVQLGGGIRTIEDIEKALDLGVKRVILGTTALDKDFLKKILQIYGDKIAVAVDSKGGKIAVEGWLKETEMDLESFVMELEKLGVACLIHTSILRDGTLEGPNYEEIKKVRAIFSRTLIASGGISSLKDLHQLKELGVDGAIIGRAIYEGKINLKEAILI